MRLGHLKELSGTALTDHYADILRKLRDAGGLLADIFAQATPRFNNPVITHDKEISRWGGVSVLW